jgi:hypothetical protein
MHSSNPRIVFRTAVKSLISKSQSYKSNAKNTSRIEFCANTNCISLHTLAVDKWTAIERDTQQITRNKTFLFDIKCFE